VVCLGISGKALYARGSVVRQGSKVAGKYNIPALKSFVELTSLTAVADQCTVVFPKDAVYVVHERVHSINKHLHCAQVRHGEPSMPTQKDERSASTEAYTTTTSRTDS
jgi:hypothetical protein